MLPDDTGAFWPCRRPRTVYGLTAAGRRAFESHRAAVSGLLAAPR